MTRQTVARTIISSVALAFALALGSMSVSSVHAQGAAGKYASLFAANKKGGKSLVTAIAAAAQAGPDEAKLIIEQALLGTPEQQMAAAAGLRKAYDMALSNGNAETAAAIQDSVAAAGDTFATAFAGGEGNESNVGADSRQKREATEKSSTGNSDRPVSPAKPK
jgi:hypothetical protein